MTFSERFTNLLNIRSITPYRVHKDTGIPEATIGRWKNGKAVPSGDNLVKVCDYLGVTPGYLLSGDEKNKPATNDGNELTERQRKYLDKIDRMSDEQYKMLEIFMAGLEKSDQ